jgi:hypothetical protein
MLNACPELELVEGNTSGRWGESNSENEYLTEIQVAGSAS